MHRASAAGTSLRGGPAGHAAGVINVRANTSLLPALTTAPAVASIIATSEATTSNASLPMALRGCLKSFDVFSVIARS
jgi:hypothetical protein